MAEATAATEVFDVLLPVYFPEFEEQIRQLDIAVDRASFATDLARERRLPRRAADRQRQRRCLYDRI